MEIEDTARVDDRSIHVASNLCQHQAEEPDQRIDYSAPNVCPRHPGRILAATRLCTTPSRSQGHALGRPTGLVEGLLIPNLHAVEQPLAGVPHDLAVFDDLASDDEPR